MRPDNKTINKILSMNDSDLKKLIADAAGKGGVSLSTVSDEDLTKFKAVLGGLGNDPKIVSELLKTLGRNPKQY